MSAAKENATVVGVGVAACAVTVRSPGGKARSPVGPSIHTCAGAESRAPAGASRAASTMAPPPAAAITTGMITFAQNTGISNPWLPATVGVTWPVR